MVAESVALKGLWKVGGKVGWTVCKMVAYSDDLKV